MKFFYIWRVYQMIIVLSLMKNFQQVLILQRLNQWLLQQKTQI